MKRLGGLVVAMLAMGSAWGASERKEAELDAAKPLAAQVEQIRRDLQGEKYSEISQQDKAKVSAALERMERTMASHPGVAANALPADRQVEIFNDQELVNVILTKAREDSRLVCRRERPVGSNLARSTCMTLAERRRRAEQDRSEFSHIQQRAPAELTGGR